MLKFLVGYLVGFFAGVTLVSAIFFDQIRSKFLFLYYRRIVRRMFESIRWIIVNGTDDQIKQMALKLYTSNQDGLRELGEALSSDEGIKRIKGIINAT